LVFLPATEFSFYLRKSSQVALAVGLLAATSMWCYADFLLIPHQRMEAARLGIPRGNLSDLYPRWLGARELLLHGRDPYGGDLTREIQRGYYGRQLDQTRPNDPKDQQGFAYPVYVTFLLAPTVRADFHQVQAAFRWLLILLTAATVPLWFRALGWKPSLLTVSTWVIFALGSFAAVQGIKLQQLTLVVCGFLAAAMAALVSGHLILAGVLMSLSTIKPQLAGMLMAWLLLWTAGDWRRRKALAYSFSTTLLALVLGGEWLLPGWISKFRAAASAYLQYTGGGKSVLDVALGPQLGALAAVLVVIPAAIFCWKYRRAPAEHPSFAWSMALVLAATLVVIPSYAPYNQLLLLPVLMLIVREAGVLWKRDKLGRWLVLITTVCVFWAWLTSALLCVLLLFLPRARPETLWALPLAASLWVPISVLGLTALCVWRGTRGQPMHVATARS
jgi:hypothetical protein